MDELEFRGLITSGVRRHVTLYVPGRAELAQAPNDWPDTLHPGSLNVRIDPAGYPTAFGHRYLAVTVAALDKGLFAPAFEIRRDQFRNNQIVPSPQMPRAGDAQVWRARISTKLGSADLHCWALRRFGSRVGEQLELVAEGRLRSFGLMDGQAVIVTLLGQWRDA